MKWSKLKAMAEELLCDSLKGRVHYHLVVHRKSHDQTRTFRMTWDGNEIFRASDMPFAMAVNARENELIVERQLHLPEWEGDWQTFWESEELKHLHAACDDAELEMMEKGLFAAWEIVPLLFDYVQMPFAEAIVHEHPFIRALCVLDRRFGKRRLLEVDPELESDVYKAFLDMRMN